MPALLTSLAQLRPFVFVMDGSEVGRGYLAMVVSVLNGRRPCWSLGSWSEAKTGDGEFDSVALQQALGDRGWDKAMR